jgi:hypothetical protein
MKCCEGQDHDCDLTALYGRERGKGYRRVPNVNKCEACIESGCTCLGIHRQDPMRGVLQVPVKYKEVRVTR